MRLCGELWLRGASSPRKLIESHSAFEYKLMKSIRVFDMLRGAPGAVSGATGTRGRGSCWSQGGCAAMMCNLYHIMIRCYITCNTGF